MSPSSTMTSPRLMPMRKRMRSRSGRLALRSSTPLLHDDGAAHGIDHRSELDQHAVASGLEDASTVLVDQRIDQFTPMALENGERLFLVRAHQPRIFDDIGAEDRRQPPLYAFLHQSPPRLPG